VELNRSLKRKLWNKVTRAHNPSASAYNPNAECIYLPNQERNLDSFENAAIPHLSFCLVHFAFMVAYGCSIEIGSDRTLFNLCSRIVSYPMIFALNGIADVHSNRL